MSKADYWDEIEEAFEKVDIYSGREAFERDAANHPDWKIDLLAVHWTMSEVMNGGLEQYFANPTAVLAPEAVLGFERLGNQEVADALRSAMAKLGDPYPTDQDERVTKLTEVTGREPDDDLAFSLAPKAVMSELNIEGSDGEEEGPFDELEEIFFAVPDEFEEVMDEYAGRHLG